MRNLSIIEIGLMTIRNSCQSNMWNRSKVQALAFHHGFYETVTAIEEIPSSYVTLLEWCDTAIDSELPIEEIPTDNHAARTILEGHYKKEITLHKELCKKRGLTPLPFEYSNQTKIELIEQTQKTEGTYYLYHHALCLGDLEFYHFKNCYAVHEKNTLQRLEERHEAHLKAYLLRAQSPQLKSKIEQILKVYGVRKYL